ncbi:MAG: bifunctional folylpolyglutamate synthase/dihydrofolate synthase, partial [Prevotella sp.]|nr:bifunctional folylpolyglutamate synthase/dihydrofolate synthase [Prevotella sp.]
FGMVDDKDIGRVMDMTPSTAKYYFTKADSKRALHENTVKQLAASHGLTGDSYPDVSTAYRAALEIAGEDDVIFVGGSCYVIADFLKSCI